MGKVVCKSCGCENENDEIFCKQCGKMIMTSEYLEENKAERQSKKTTMTVDGIRYQTFNGEPLELYMDINQDRKVKSNRKKMWITIAAIAVSVVLLALAIIGIVFASNGVKTDVSYDMILSSLNSDEIVTNVEINGEVQIFQVSTLDVISEEDAEYNNKYLVRVTAVRINELYELSPIDYVVTFDKEGNEYIYSSAEVEGEYKAILTPLKGVSIDVAEEKIKKTYDGAKYSKQETDLEKGIDKIYFSVDNEENTGTVVAVYKFNNTKGWVFDKIDDEQLKYKPGVTHLEENLYTNSGVKNIMFFGVDANSFSGRSDVMMLVSIDTNTSKIKLTSFMRDTYVQIPGYGDNKLNAAFALGGPEAAVGAIENTYGIKIDNYAATNFTTFKNVINSLGGVNVNITADEAGYINWQLGKNGQTGVGLVPSDGRNVTLNGQQALWLCRDRGGNGFSGDDFTRTGRQRKVIKSLISTYNEYTPTQVLSTLNNLLGNVSTDLDAEDLKWLANNSGKLFDFEIQERCAPDNGEWHAGTSPIGAWIISIDNWDEFKADIQKYIFEDLE